MMEFAVLQQEHHFLQRLLGDWVVTSATGNEDCGPESPDDRWTETVRSLDGLWYVAEGRGKMPGGRPGSVLTTLGYDPEAGHYVGTWVGSMMTKLWVYKGWIEPDGRTLTLEAEGPDFADPTKTAIYHDAITVLDDNHRRFAGSVRQPDGGFHTFMTSEMQRQS